MSVADHLVRVELELTYRVRGDVTEAELADHLAGLLTARPFQLRGVPVFPTTATTRARTAPRRARTVTGAPRPMSPATGGGRPRR